MRDRPLEAGEPVYDLINQTTVVVTDAHHRTVEDHDWTTRSQLDGAYGNEMVNMTDSTETVEVAYHDISSRSKQTYVMPVTRLARPDITGATDGDTPTDLVARSLLTRLFSEAETEASSIAPTQLAVLCKRAGVDDEMVASVRDHTGAEVTDV